MEEVTEGWRWLCGEELDFLPCLPNISRTIKWKPLRWVVHAASTDRRGWYQKFWWKNLEERTLLDLRIDRKILSKCFFKFTLQTIYNWFCWVWRGAYDKRCANVEMKTMILEIARNFLISWATLGLSGGTVLRIRKLHLCNTFQPFLYSLLSLFSKSFSTEKSSEEEI